MAIQVVGNFLFDNGLMVIKELKITDQETVSFFKELELTEVEEKIKEILKMGVVVAKTVGTAEKVDYVEKEFNKFDSKIENRLERVIAVCEMMFGDDGRFSALLEKHFGDNGKIVKDLFDPYKEGTPLYNLMKEVRSGIDEVKEQLSISKGMELSRQNTTLKGFEFEDYCEDILNNMAYLYRLTRSYTHHKSN